MIHCYVSRRSMQGHYLIRGVTKESKLLSFLHSFPIKDLSQIRSSISTFMADEPQCAQILCLLFSIQCYFDQTVFSCQHCLLSSYSKPLKILLFRDPCFTHISVAFKAFLLFSYYCFCMLNVQNSVNGRILQNLAKPSKLCSFCYPSQGPCNSGFKGFI